MILSNTYIKNESALRKYFLGNIRLNWTFGWVMSWCNFLISDNIGRIMMPLRQFL